MKKRYFILVLSLLISFSLIAEGYVDYNEGQEYPLLEDVVIVNGYIISTPINIDSDDDFISLGLNGSGTEADPYRIEYLNITDVFPIIVGGTTKHFVIQHCFLSSYNGFPLLIQSVANNTYRIYNNTLTDRYTPFGHHSEIDNSTFGEIIDNVFINSGLMVSRSESTEISNNIIDSYINLGISECPYSSIVNNSIYSSGFLNIHDSNDILIENNTLTNCFFHLNDQSGLISTYQVINNQVNEKPVFFILNLENEILGYSNVGQLILVECSNITIQNTLFNQGQIFMNGCFDTKILNNEFIGLNNESIGIYLFYSEYNLVSENTLYYCNLYLYTARYSTVTYNTISKDGGNIISVSSTHSVFHHNNLFMIDGTTNALATEFGSSNIWYETSTEEGNYWENHIGIGDYVLMGNVGSKDPFPLDEPATYPEPLEETILKLFDIYTSPNPANLNEFLYVDFKVSNTGFSSATLVNIEIETTVQLDDSDITLEGSISTINVGQEVSIRAIITVLQEGNASILITVSAENAEDVSQTITITIGDDPAGATEPTDKISVEFIFITLSLFSIGTITISFRRKNH